MQTEAEKRRGRSASTSAGPHECSYVRGEGTAATEPRSLFLRHFQQVVNTVIRHNNAAKHSGRERRETFRCESTGLH